MNTQNTFNNYVISNNNRFLTTNHQLDALTRRVTAKVEGVGCIVLLANTLFNVPQPIRPQAQFIVNISDNTVSDQCDERQLHISVRYSGVEEESGMALIRLRLPTGWYVQQAEANRLLRRYQTSKVKKVELHVHGQSVEVYLDSISKARSEVYVVNIKQQFVVNDLKPSVVTVVDYYRPELNQEVMLHISECKSNISIVAQSAVTATSCPVCTLGIADNDTQAINTSVNAIIEMLCTKYSEFVLTKPINKSINTGYKIFRPDGRGAVVIWSIMKLVVPSICLRQCVLLDNSVVSKQLLIVSRYPFKSDTKYLTVNSNLILSDADMYYNLEKCVVKLANNDCFGRSKLLNLSSIEKQRQIELNTIRAGNRDVY